MRRKLIAFKSFTSEAIVRTRGNMGRDGQNFELFRSSAYPNGIDLLKAWSKFLLLLNMIQYLYKKPKILFVGINPHFGSFERGVPFSNNKLFWYLLADAGIIEEKRDELRNDEALKRMYQEKFNSVYGLGLVNIINRPTQDVTELVKGEELPGRKKVSRIIKSETPNVVCFVGKVTYEKYIGSKKFSFGWQDNIGKSRIFVMHFPLRGAAIVRIGELLEIAGVAQG